MYTCLVNIFIYPYNRFSIPDEIKRDFVESLPKLWDTLFDKLKRMQKKEKNKRVLECIKGAIELIEMQQDD